MDRTREVTDFIEEDGASRSTFEPPLSLLHGTAERTFLVPEERRFVTPEAIQAACLVGEPEEIIHQIRAVEKAGLKEINEKAGAPAILVNNAGITADNLLMRMKDDEWDDVIGTNLSSVYRLSKAVLRGMTKGRWGRIINISSVVGGMGNAGQSNYAAAKAGMEGFTRALAREVGSRAITVNAVAPGFIDTDMTRALNDSQRSVMLEQIPLARLGQAEEIAAAVAFLASESAGYITGATLPVNGGMYM